MKSICFMVIGLICVSCGIKDASRPVPTTSNPNTVQKGEGLPENVLYSKQKKLLIYSSQNRFGVGIQRVEYRVVMANLISLPEDLLLEVRYVMPDMPEMPVAPAKIQKTAIGTWTVQYDISMGGRWDFELLVLRGKEKIDILSFSDVVPE